MLDVYCERAGTAGLWAEPLNAITNLAFVVAALLLAARYGGRLIERGPARTLDLLLLIGLLGAIGIGSGLWHTLPRSWTLLADVLPITLLINLFLLSFGRRVLALGWWELAGLWAGYQAAAFGAVVALGPEALNGSAGYLPALAFLGLFWLWLRARRHPMALSTAAAALLFAVSLTLRTEDLALCPALPIGTHFLWHLLNALLLYLLLDALIRHGMPREERGAPTPHAL
jgi:hypothetical protein